MQCSAQQCLFGKTTSLRACAGRGSCWLSIQLVSNLPLSRTPASQKPIPLVIEGCYGNGYHLDRHYMYVNQRHASSNGRILAPAAAALPAGHAGPMQYMYSTYVQQGRPCPAIYAHTVIKHSISLASCLQVVSYVKVSANTTRCCPGSDCTQHYGTNTILQF
jgi:hypothetical protein